MADIFISYKKEDAGRVVRIVEGLRTEGFTVWWDHGIAPGSQWDQTIQRELNEAKLVIAVWSELSVNAPWVKEEASVGKSKGVLLPVRIDDIEPPLGFGLIQTANLFDWDGDVDDPHWDHFIAAVRAIMSGKPVEGLEKPVRKKNSISKVLPVLFGMLLIAGAGWFVSTQTNLISRLDDQPGIASSSNTAVTPATANQPSDAERAMFEKAQSSALKADYLDYLRAYNQGYYADKIRNEVLPFCSFQQKDKWVPQSVQQTLRGVSSGTEVGNEDKVFETEVAACEAAKADVSKRAEQTCRLIVNNSSGRNPNMQLEWNPCDCKFVVDSWICSVDPVYSCAWELKSFENIEICT